MKTGLTLMAFGLTCAAGALTTTTQAATPTAIFVRQEASIDRVEHIEPVSKVVEEKYPCRSGAGMGICVNKKHIRRPGGIKIHLIVDSNPDQPLAHFLPNTPISAQPEHSVGQRVCVETMHGTFGTVVATVETLGESDTCATAAPYR